MVNCSLLQRTNGDKLQMVKLQSSSVTSITTKGLSVPRMESKKCIWNLGNSDEEFGSKYLKLNCHIRSAQEHENLQVEGTLASQKASP